MAKFDAVDRLMKLATEKPGSGARRGTARDPEQVVPTQVETSEPATPLPQRAAEPPISPGERGRQLLGAIRPLLPAVGGALRMVDHGAVQAVARLLPLLGAARSAGVQPNAMPGLPQSTSDRERNALERELTSLQARVDAQEEQLRRMREVLERTVAEQGSLSHRAHGIESRVRMLTAGLVILLLLVIAEGVLLALALHR